MGEGNWLSALALFVYAAGFSFAYLSLPAATGALLLFGSVQVTMIGYGLFRGERLARIQVMGLLLALAGLVGLLLPALSTPSLFGSIVMTTAGIAWGVYSLRGSGIIDPIKATAGNFLRAVPMTLILSVVMFEDISFDIAGFCYAIASGGLASGIGYAIWYTVLPALKTANAATVQLSVPVIAAFAGIILLGEPLSIQFVIASLAIISGIALVIMQKQNR